MVRSLPTLWPLVAVEVAVVVRLLPEPLMGDRIPFAPPFAAVVFVAWYGGRGPALLALAVGPVATGYFLLLPRYSFAFDQAEHRVGLVAVALFDSPDKARRQVRERRTQLEQEVTRIPADGPPIFAPSPRASGSRERCAKARSDSAR